MTEDLEAITGTVSLHLGDAQWHDGPGWYYTLDEYPDEGSCGAFPTKDEAIAHARGCGYSLDMSNPMPDPLSHNDPKPGEEKTEEKPMTETLPEPEEEQKPLTETPPAAPNPIFA